jgi:hypothetical protein
MEGQDAFSGRFDRRRNFLQNTPTSQHNSLQTLEMNLGAARHCLLDGSGMTQNRCRQVHSSYMQIAAAWNTSASMH